MSADDRSPLDHGGRGQNRHALSQVKGNRAIHDIPERRASVFGLAPEEPFPTVVVGKSPQHLHADRDGGEGPAPPAEQLQAFREEEEEQRQGVGQHSRSEAVAAVPLAPTSDEDEVSERSETQCRREPSIAETKRPDQPGHCDDGDRGKHEQPLGRRYEQPQLPDTPGFAEALRERSLETGGQR